MRRLYVQFRDRLSNLEEQERVASAKATAASAQCASGTTSAGVADGVGGSPGDPAFALLTQPQGLEAKAKVKAKVGPVGQLGP